MNPMYALFREERPQWKGIYWKDSPQLQAEYQAWGEQLVADARNKDIVSVIAQYTALERMGSNLSGSCPFHPDTKKKGHFFVFQDTNTCKCYYAGCEKGGDVIKVVMELEEVTFEEAILILNNKPILTPAGQKERPPREPLPEYVPPEPEPRIIGNDITMEDIQRWNHNLLRNPELMSWLDKRGVPKDAVIEGRLGYTAHDPKLPTITYHQGEANLGWAQNKLTIGWFRCGELTGVKLRNSPFLPKRDGSPYVSIPNAIDMSYLYGIDDIGGDTNTVFLVESEYDRWLVKYIFEFKRKDGYPAVVLSKPANGFTEKTIEPLYYMSRVISLLDNDAVKNGLRAGLESGYKIQDLIAHTELYLPPQGKDVGDFYKWSSVDCVVWLNRILMQGVF